MVRLLPWMKLMRPHNAAISLVGTVIGGLSVVGLSVPHLWEYVGALLLAGVTTFLVTSGGNVLNDYLDVEGDRLNHPDRPLPMKEVSREAARRFSIALFVLSAIPLLFLSPSILNPFPKVPGDYAVTWVVWTSSVAILVGYELRLKALGFVGNSSVAYLTGAVFLFGGSVVGNPILALPWLLMAFFASLSREVVKDMEDVAGDVDRVTLPKKFGMAAASITGRLSVAVAIAISPLPLLTWLSPLSPAGLAYMILVGITDAFFILSVVWLPQRLHREQGLSKLAMVFALVSFMGASLR